MDRYLQPLGPAAAKKKARTGSPEKGGPSAVELADIHDSSSDESDK